MGDVPPTNPYLLQPLQGNVRTRSATPTGTRGSATQTITSTPTSRPSTPSDPPLVLRLRGSHSPSSHISRRTVSNNIQQDPEEEDEDEDVQGRERVKRRRRIQWDESVVDNEGLGRKKSKVCCIYHKPRAVGESSSDESSSSSSSDEMDSDSGGSGYSDGAKMVGSSKRRGRRGNGRKHDHDHHDRDHDHDGDDGTEGKPKPRRRRKPSPNAYEKMPKYDVKPLTKQPA